MPQRFVLLLFLMLGLLVQSSSHAKVKLAGKKIAKHNAHVKLKSTHKHSKRGKKHKGKKEFVLVPKDPAQIEMIAQNKERMRIIDSVHNSYVQLDNKEVEEGYFASLFSKQKKMASFVTLEGTASVFKSVSGWEDKKFYILTNELPIGTIVRITTSDLKSICAKVISTLPDVSNSIQYRLSDAAAALLGMNNKTFKISVTY